MVMLNEFSPATRSSTDLGASGTDVNAMVEVVLHPPLALHDLTDTSYSFLSALGAVTVNRVLLVVVSTTVLPELRT